MESNDTRNLTSADANTTVLVRGKSGIMTFYNVLKTSAHTVALYDDNQTGTQVAANLICTIPASATVGTYRIQRALRKGLVAVVAASFAADHLISHRAG